LSYSHFTQIFAYVGPFKASSRYIGYITMGDSIYNAEGGFSLTTLYLNIQNLSYTSQDLSQTILAV